MGEEMNHSIRLCFKFILKGGTKPPYIDGDTKKLE